MTTLCNCCRQPFAGEVAGYHRGEPLCAECATALAFANLTVTDEP